MGTYEQIQHDDGDAINIRTTNILAQVCETVIKTRNEVDFGDIPKDDGEMVLGERIAEDLAGLSSVHLSKIAERLRGLVDTPEAAHKWE